MDPINLVISPYSTIEENLALEQFYMMINGNYILLYKASKCIVLGRNQVSYSEISVKEQQRNKIPIVRRRSGGGAVFLDEGVMNYAFIMDYENSMNTYSFFNRIIIDILRDIGFKNIVENDCNLFFDNFKISGTAQYKRKNRIIHHGTILINSDIDLINRIFINSVCYRTKAKRSVSSHTINLKYIDKSISMNSFETMFCHYLKMKYCIRTKIDSDGINEFVLKRQLEFKENDWIFGNSPDYEFSNDVYLENGVVVKVSLEIRKGKILKQNISGNSILNKSDFKGCYHSFEDFFPIIMETFGNETHLQVLNSICYQFFNEERRA